MIAVLDLKTQYAAIGPEIDAAIKEELPSLLERYKFLYDINKIDEIDQMTKRLKLSTAPPLTR